MYITVESFEAALVGDLKGKAEAAIKTFETESADETKKFSAAINTNLDLAFQIACGKWCEDRVIFLSQVISQAKAQGRIAIAKEAARLLGINLSQDTLKYMFDYNVSINNFDAIKEVLTSMSNAYRYVVVEASLKDVAIPIATRSGILYICHSLEVKQPNVQNNAQGGNQGSQKKKRY